jgi:hypothetical protein
MVKGLPSQLMVMLVQRKYGLSWRQVEHDARQRMMAEMLEHYAKVHEEETGVRSASQPGTPVYRFLEFMSCVAQPMRRFSIDRDGAFSWDSPWLNP